MNYPLISEYIESVKLAEDNFEELNYLRPVLDAEGLPVMSSGNFAVVFKMKDERDGKLYAVRCFHRDQEGRAESYRLIEEELRDVESPYLVSFRYMDKELFVDSSQTDETEFPVLLMDWVEGITLDKYLRENLDDQYALEMLAYRFSQLAQWLIPQPFAHGDLKPDNILVREDGNLVLVDYDGMYVPAMKGQKARELGSPDFRHPLRTEDDFNEHIDDFPLASILLSLKAISINPSLLEEYGATDRLLFSEKDYRDSARISLLKGPSLIYDVEINAINSVLVYFLNRRHAFFGEIPSLTSNIIISKPEMMRNIVTRISCDEWNNSVQARFVPASATSDKWALYSKNQKKLLRFQDYDAGQCGEDIWEEGCFDYSILEGTRIICDNAFVNCHNLYFLQIPSTVKFIGKNAFKGCWFNSISLPDLEWISEDAFEDCPYLQTIAVPMAGLPKYAQLLPNNIKQLKAIDQITFRKRICSYLKGEEDWDNKNMSYFERMASLFMKINEIRGRSHANSCSWHYYGKSACVFLKNERLPGCCPQLHINDTENIEELTNAMCSLLLDVGIIDIFVQ